MADEQQGAAGSVQTTVTLGSIPRSVTGKMQVRHLPRITRQEAVKRFVTTYKDDKGNEYGGMVDAVDWEHAQSICDQRGRGEVVEGQLMCVADGRMSPEQANQMLENFMANGPVDDDEIPEAEEFGFEIDEYGDFILDKRNEIKPASTRLPLYDWKIPPCGRCFTVGMTWGRLFEWLHGTVAHVLFFGVIPTFYALGHDNSPWLKFWWYVIAGLTLVRAVLFGSKPTVVGFFAFCNLFKRNRT